VIYLEVIWQAIKANAIGLLIGLGGLICTLSMFMPRHWKIFKFIKWAKKK
tara:strand:- start:924 stop:1073 length:150 start_codon:yes stop_codon:yes gene_type:complete